MPKPPAAQGPPHVAWTRTSRGEWQFLLQASNFREAHLEAYAALGDQDLEESIDVQILPLGQHPEGGPRHASY